MVRRTFQPSPETFGEIVSQLLVDNSLVQSRVVKQLRVSQTALVLWKQGKRIPSTEAMVRALAKRLGAGKRTAELVAAAGFGRKPAPSAVVVTMLADFLASPQIPKKSKQELSSLVQELLKAFRLPETSPFRWKIYSDSPLGVSYETPPREAPVGHRDRTDTDWGQ